MKYRNISGHPEDLEGGRLIAAGETFELSSKEAESEFNKDKLSNTDNFVEVHEESRKSRRQRQLGEGGGNQNADGEGNAAGDENDGGNA